MPSVSLSSRFLFAASLVLGHSASLLADETIEFNRDVRPILSDHCYRCHGPDGGQRQAELRLDQQESAEGPRDSGPAVAPGNPEESELIRRISSSDPDLRMPPAGGAKPLNDRQRKVLRDWIAQGAKWQPHWSLQPPRRPELPEAATPDEQPIDRFIRRRLDREGLAMSPEADRRTLLRRLSFDLTGLPPTPEEVAQFLSDTSPDAYARQVDRLLDSQRFGERLAVYWLDVVRYADTNGIHGDNHREHWLYRDYVIDAFNRNLPFDQFTVEQLAGDLLPDRTRSQRIASGYNRLNMTTREGGAQAKEYIAKYAADRVRNASSVWMGATLGCAECHDHKFDDYTSRDFYRFAAFFADVEETPVGQQTPAKLPTDEQLAALEAIDLRIEALEKRLQQDTPELQAEQAQWEASLREAPAPAWAPAAIGSAMADGGVQLEVAEDGVVAAAGPNPGQTAYRLRLSGIPDGATALRIEALPHASLPAKGPGRAGNGNFVLSEVRLTIGGQPQAWGRVEADHSQKDWPAAAAADGKPETGWAVLPHVGQPHQILLAAAAPLRAPDKSDIELTLEFRHPANHSLGRLRASWTTAPDPKLESSGLPAEILKIVAVEKERRDAKQRQALADFFRASAPSLAPLRQQHAELEAQEKQMLAAAPESLVTRSVAPRMVRVLPRGNWLDDSGEPLTPGVPEFLPQLPPRDDRATREDLARWLVDPQNPYTARVFVNRMWKLMFGHGIVRTLDDFGAQGAWPSHPELLDYLAVEFRESGWDVKALIRSLANSRTYRQKSGATPELRARDPYNSLFARQSRYRLDAEQVRDNALAVSGLLVEQIGGPSVKPYQPEGYWSHLNFPRRTYQADQGPSQYRRGLYTYWCRTFLHPSLAAFDAPSREECTVERPRSNTPLAALVLLNDPSYVEAARALAERILQENPAAGDGERLAAIFRRVLCRTPAAAEQSALLALLQSHRQQYQDNAAAAEQLTKVGQAPRRTETAAAELAAWTSVARVVLNLHETITRN